MNRRLAAALVVVSLLSATVPVAGQQPPPDSDRAPLGFGDNAQLTRNELGSLLNDYPPTLRRILALDPSLLNPTYLAPYPRLAQFVQEHPEIARNPSFFLGSPDFGGSPDAVEVFAVVLAGMGIFIGVMTILTILASLARQVIDYRRWLRHSRIQIEMHSKIFDRLTSNEELMAYVQSPAGRRFLEAAPGADVDPRAMSAPVGRILWSVQLGVVLGTLGAGLWVVQRNMTIPEEVLPAFYVLSVVAVALGVGAVISSVVAYVLSARLGLLPAHGDGSRHA